MTTDAQTIPNTIITSSWGVQINDRVVQIYASKAALDAGSPNWYPEVGSFAYTIAERGLWRWVGNAWESAMPRGFRVNRAQTTVDITNGQAGWSVLAYHDMGTIRQGYTYLVHWSGNPYVRAASRSLWSGQVYLRDQATGSDNSGFGWGQGCGGGNVYSNGVHPAGTSWPQGDYYLSTNVSGVAAIGPMLGNVAAGQVVWRAQTYAGWPVVTMDNVHLSITEVGAPS